MRPEEHRHGPRRLFKALLAGFAIAQLGAASVGAQSTAFVYQGLVRVQAQVFSGPGQFKFALLSAPENSARQAQAIAVVNSGFITSYTVTDVGAGYSAAPTVTITDSTGSNAMATAVVSMGQVSSLMVVAPGSGYSASPQVMIGPPETNSSPRTSWSNDGTSVNGSEPATSVSIDVAQGAFMVRLGDSQLDGMTPIPLSVFDKSDLRLRIWFNDGAHGFARLAPDQVLAPTPFAIKLLAEEAKRKEAKGALGYVPS